MYSCVVLYLYYVKIVVEFGYIAEAQILSAFSHVGSLLRRWHSYKVECIKKTNDVVVIEITMTLLSILNHQTFLNTLVMACADPEIFLRGGVWTPLTSHPSISAYEWSAILKRMDNDLQLLFGCSF